MDKEYELKICKKEKCSFSLVIGENIKRIKYHSYVYHYKANYTFCEPLL